MPNRSAAAAARKRARERKAQQTPEAIRARIVENHAKQKKVLEEQAALLVNDSQELQEKEAEARDGNISRQHKRALERTRDKLEGRGLRLLERDEEYVRSALRRREKLLLNRPISSYVDELVLVFLGSIYFVYLILVIRSDCSTSAMSCRWRCGALS